MLNNIYHAKAESLITNTAIISSKCFDFKQSMYKIINECKYKGTNKEHPQFIFLWKHRTKNESKKESNHIQEYNTLTEKTHHTKTKPPDGFQYTRVDIYGEMKDETILNNRTQLGKYNIFNGIKNHTKTNRPDECYKQSVDTYNHLECFVLKSIYSTYVIIHGFRLIKFLTELNKMNLWVTDIGNEKLNILIKELDNIRAFSNHVMAPEYILSIGQVCEYIKTILKHIIIISDQSTHDNFVNKLWLNPMKLMIVKAMLL
jgi:hypothetical protein